MLTEWEDECSNTVLSWDRGVLSILQVAEVETLDLGQVLDLEYGLVEHFELVAGTDSRWVLALRLLQAVKGLPAGAHRLQMQGGPGSGPLSTRPVQRAAVLSRWDSFGLDLSAGE